MIRRFFALTLLIVAATADAQVTLTRGTNFTVDVAADGRMAFDLLGRIWIIPPGGGVAREIDGGPPAARRPRWSSDSSALVFQARENGQAKLWHYDVEKKRARKLTAGQFFDHQPAWHPDASRIVYSSDRHDTGFDLWEYDLATGLTWRISNHAGDETEPAWSANGEDLVYLHRRDDEWALVLRQKGQPERILETSDVPLSSPSWRPDGSLVTFIRHNDDRLVAEMVILSEPLLIRPLIEAEDLFVAPISWLDRHVMLYAANGMIREREFNSWNPRTVPFRASFLPQTGPKPRAPVARELPVSNEPGGQLVVRAARLFDGIGGGYRDDVDIVMEGGRTGWPYRGGRSACRQARCNCCRYGRPDRDPGHDRQPCPHAKRY